MVPGLLDCYWFRTNGKGCAPNAHCNFGCSVYVRAYVSYVIPATILPTILYGLLYCKGRKVQKELASNAAAQDNHRKEWKATITFSLLFFSLFAFNLPSTIIEVTVRAAFSGRMFSAAAYTILTFNSSLFSLLIITDPIVIMRDSDVKEILLGIRNKVFCKEVRRPTAKIDTGIATPLQKITAHL